MNTLPDDALLAIFKSYLDEYSYEGDKKGREDAWRLLVHVCRRWRSIVFGLPHHLDLELVCTTRTPARDTLDVWPGLPLIIDCRIAFRIRRADNITAVLERSDRVREIFLANVGRSDWEIYMAAMQQPFPELVYLRLGPNIGAVRVVPDSFLGGFAPRLEDLRLQNIPFPGLPKLLLSATHLVNLSLYQVSYSHIFSEEIVAALSTLISLESLKLGFKSSRFFPERATRHLPLSTRTVLPVLTLFCFEGVSGYLEDFVSRIDTPRLIELFITFFDDVAFDTSQLNQFISRTRMLRPLEKAHMTFWDEDAYVKFLSQSSGFWPRRSQSGTLTSMPWVGTASIFCGAGLYLVPAPPFYVGGPLHLQAPQMATRYG